MAAGIWTYVFADYESGDLSIFAVDHDDEVIWASDHEPTEEGASECVQEFAAIEVAGMNPVYEGWKLHGFKDLDDAQRAYDELSVPGVSFTVANAEWYNGLDSDMCFGGEDVDGVPESARMFREWYYA